MRAVKIIKRLLSESLEEVHSKRIQSLLWGIKSLISGEKLSLTAIGRSALQGKKVKNNIKRADRLLGNKRLHKDFVQFYAVLAATLIGKNKRPIILVDWTKAPQKHQAISAAIPYSGRALNIYSEVYPKNTKGQTKIETQFLKTLKSILPIGCIPIIVTDSGFRNPWFKAVRKLGWDYVGRFRNKLCVRRVNGVWIYTDVLLSEATQRPTVLGDWITSKTTPYKSRLISINTYKKQKGKKCKSKKSTSAQQKASRRAKEALLLTTSLSELTAKQVVKIYGARMQIEELFRDMKNHRFGWSFAYSRSTDSARINTLILIASFAMLAVTLVGQAAENKGIHFDYQANTIKHRRVLSLFYLGLQVIRRREHRQFPMSQLVIILQQLSSYMTAFLTEQMVQK